MKKQKFNHDWIFTVGSGKLPGCIGWWEQYGKTGDSAA